MVKNEDGRTVKPGRIPIHPDERVKTARRVKTTYRARRSFGLSATDARKAAHEKRVACALASNLPTFYVEA